MIARVLLAAVQGGLAGFGAGALLVSFFLLGGAYVAPSAILTISCGPALLGALAMAASTIDERFFQ